MSCEIFPDRWKKSIIRPIPKLSSDLASISDYRPILLLSIDPNIFESIVSYKLISVLDKIIVYGQRGIRLSKSITTNLLTL